MGLHDTYTLREYLAAQQLSKVQVHTILQQAFGAYSYNGGWACSKDETQ